MDKLFVIAIGGTGMRCLESFVHLCAMGLFDNQTIDILTLDTDQSNGNKGRVENLIELYNKIKSDDANNIDGGRPNADTFFSAKSIFTNSIRFMVMPTERLTRFFRVSTADCTKTRTPT